MRYFGPSRSRRLEVLASLEVYFPLTVLENTDMYHVCAPVDLVFSSEGLGITAPPAFGVCAKQLILLSESEPI